MGDIQHIHLIAICGTGMGSLAGLLKERGHRVTGSDQNVYPPMSTELEALGITLCQGYGADNLSPRPDLVIIGNAVSKNNPEVEEVIRLGIPYLSMPQAVSRFFIEGKKSIVIAGTHGKTTTTALMAHCLIDLKSEPGYLIGGVLHGEKNYAAGSGAYFAIEGDEYDTAFFDKGPKFLHYQPYYTIITSLEFDHADIYRDIDHLTASFAALIEKNDPKGFLMLYGPSDRLISLAQKSGKAFHTYGLEPQYDWNAQNIVFSSEGVDFDIFFKNQKEITVHTPMAGRHNVQNALAVYGILRRLNFEPQAIKEVLNTFKGVKRRQEIRGVVGNITVMDDFAHHPTAVLETIGAIKSKYPNHKIWAVFEPRSASSKRSIFHDQYTRAFDQADHVILAGVFMPEKVKDAAVLDVPQLTKDISARGKDALFIAEVDDIVTHLAKNAKGPAVILIMSNGGFGGIHNKVISALQNKFPKGDT